MKKIIVLLVFITLNVSHSQTWVQYLNGISIWSLGSSPVNGYLYAGSLGSGSQIYRSTNGGTNWDPLASANGQTVFAIAIDSMNNIYAANSTAGLMISTNGGANFWMMTTGIFGGYGVQAVACGKNGEVYVGTNGGGFYKSIDGGSSFSFMGMAGTQIVSLLVDRFNPSKIYIGVSSVSAGLNGFYMSTNSGATFSANLDPNKNIFGIVQYDVSTLYTASTTTGGPVDKSNDGGLNWSTTASGYVARGICRGRNNDIFLAGNGGVFRSTDNGITFANFGITASSTPVMYVPVLNKMFAGVTGSTNGGVWVYEYPLGITPVSTEIPQQFSLYQNYPNPFNPSTRIRFNIPLLRGVAGEDGRGVSVKLKIFSITGSDVATLVDQQLNPGSYEVTFDASNLSTGVYFYRLTAGNFTETKKLLLIK